MVVIADIFLLYLVVSIVCADGVSQYVIASWQEYRLRPETKS